MEFGHLLQIISWIELSALCDVWPVVTQALSLLVEAVHDVKRFKLQSETSDHLTEFMELSTRVCLLLCDQVSITGLIVRRIGAMSQPPFIPLREDEEKSMCHMKEKVSTVSRLLVKLVHACPSVGWQVVDSLAGIMEALAQQDLDQYTETGSRNWSGVNTDQHVSIQDKNCGQKEGVDSCCGMETMIEKGSTHGGLEVVLTELGRCLCVCASFSEYEAETIENIHRRLLGLVDFFLSRGSSDVLLLTAVQALTTADLAHSLLLGVTKQVGESTQLEELADSQNRARGRTCRLLIQTKKSLHRIAVKYMQGGNLRICYELGKQGALGPVWNLAHFSFDSLVDKISSEGCYLWLRALSFQSRAEAALCVGNFMDKGDTDEEREQIDTSACTNQSEDKVQTRC
jgi:hypothetical protein